MDNLSSDTMRFEPIQGRVGEEIEFDQRAEPMRKKDSKIPLVLTFLVLGYFIFWAFGYVSRNQPARARPTVVAPQRQAVVDIDRRQPTPVQTEVAPPAPTPEIPQQRVVAEPMAEGTANPLAHSGEVEFEDKPNGNRKILGILRETTGKH